MAKAGLLDRNRTLNRLVLNPKTNDYEPPHYAKDMELYPYAIDCLKQLAGRGYLLFLVSNQPDYAKGKTTMEALERVNKKFDKLLRRHDVNFTEYYYCYHHPNGIVKGYSYDCESRKPSRSSC